MAKIQNTKKQDMVRALIRVSNLSKGIAMHLILLIYVVLLVFTQIRLSNHEFVILIFVFVVGWYWFARIFEKQGRKKGIKRPRILIVENIVETIGLALVLWFFGRSNGPLFFFYAFVLMESCLLLSAKLPWVIMGIGGSITITEFFYLVHLGEIQLTANAVVFLFIRLIFFVSLASHFSTLAKVNISEKKKTDDLKEMTEELKKTYDELKRTDRLKSEFLGMSSHQLRTPLTVIKGYLSMTLEGDYGKVPPKIKVVLGNVFSASQRLVKIVGDLLNISRIDLGKMKLEKTTVQIDDMLKSCHEEMKMKAEEKGLKMIYEKPTSPLPKIQADESQVRQVILNLIDNAIRYTMKGEIVISAEKKKNSILVKVSDTGVGLSKDEQKDIFEGFTRGSAGINHFTEGAGLGLYVSKKYLDLHKGKIWSKSPGKDKGSTFFVELPI